MLNETSSLLSRSAPGNCAAATTARLLTATAKIAKDARESAPFVAAEAVAEELREIDILGIGPTGGVAPLAPQQRPRPPQRFRTSCHGGRTSRRFLGSFKTSKALALPGISFSPSYRQDAGRDDISAQAAV